jgi:hypothetical protein
VTRPQEARAKPAGNAAAKAGPARQKPVQAKPGDGAAKLSRAVGYAAPEHAVARGDGVAVHSRFRVRPLPGLGAVSFFLQAGLIALIVLASVVMTVKSIIVSVADRTSVVKSKAQEVLSGFGIDLGGLFGEREESEVSAALDPWETAAANEEYQLMILALLVVAGIVLALFVIWQSLAERSLPGVFGNSPLEIAASSPWAWLIPLWNIVQPPLSLVRVGRRASVCERFAQGTSGVIASVAVFWVSLLCGAGLMWAGGMWPPERMDTQGVMLLVVGPLLVVVGCAVAAGLVGRLTRTILRAGAMQGAAEAGRVR